MHPLSYNEWRLLELYAKRDLNQKLETKTISSDIEEVNIWLTNKERSWDWNKSKHHFSEHKETESLLDFPHIISSTNERN